MYPTGSKPDHRQITLQKLIDDNFTRYHSAIHKIFMDAKAEFNIEKEIEKIENAIEKISLRAEIFEVGEKMNFYIIKDISAILIKLNDEHSKV